MAAVSFTFVQPMSNKTGLKMMPPPMPISPEKKPKKAPMATATAKLKGIISLIVFLGTYTILATAKNRKMPRIILKIWGSIVIRAPRKCHRDGAYNKGD